tara:strand:+ start:46167 stop:56558 length:10392 start_codon:yes stop_codon:yes gene_type:complete
MKKNDTFLNPILEENKSKVFIGDRYNSVSSEDSERYNDVTESPEYAEAYKKLAERVIPVIDVRDPSTWAFYGSAEKYYRDAFQYIHDSYPYDGSALEKINWSLSASAIDLAVFQHEYPLETGHIGFSTSSWGSLSGAKSGIYGLPDSPEYVKFSGGPYVGTVIDSSTKRESSLKLDPSLGNTIEFWLKKDAFVPAAKTESEVVFDSHTIDFAEGNAAYGRFLLELSASSGSPVYITYMSGTAGADRRQIGQNITTSSVADGQFHHYAITALHTGSNLEVELYIDGAFNDSISIGAANMGAINSYFNASLGALRTTKNSNGGLGYGKLSGSIDEFRFWKTKRTAEQIGNYFDFPVNGATDSEKIDSVLGVYFKFNEGVQGSDTKDNVIIDYSGRLNNGEFVGYTSTARSRDSAITLSSQTSQRETGDPILVPSTARVRSSLDELVKIGKAYDEINHSSLMRSVPQWAYDSEAGSSNIDSDFSVLLQIVGQQFDSIRMLIDGLPKIGFTQYKDYVHAKGSANYLGNSQFHNLLGCEKDFSIDFGQMFGEENFSAQNLLSKGMTVTVSPIVDKATLNEYFYNLKFDIADPETNLSQALIHSKAENVKNKILNSVHSNIAHVYKAKGTKDSFRNIIRCFGVDDDLVFPNIYAQNVENFIKNEPVFDSKTIKALVLTGSNSEVTLYQTASATNERAYITGSTSPAAITLESRILFPHLVGKADIPVTASVFGMNQVSGSNLKITNPNYAGIRVKAIKSQISQAGCSFSLSSSAAIFNELTTGYFHEVYANTPWYLAVRFSEDTQTPLVNSDNKPSQSYKVDFIGYRYDQDVKTSEFHLTASITESNFQSFMAANKSVFIGADKENITGSVVNSSDFKVLSFTAWNDHISNKEMQEHAKSLENIGRINPLFAKRLNQGQSRLTTDSLILNWIFDDVQHTDTTTNYIYDNASGSLSNISKSGDILGYKYPAVTHNLQHQAGSIQREYLASLKYLPVDNLESKSRIEIKDREIEKFEISSRPISYLHSYEKSMYQVISQEMLNMLAGVEAFNNLIGEPVYKYRQEYKTLEKLRDRFFANVENEIEFERFVEYYKWIDKSLASLLEQLQPATSAMNVGMEDVVESHAFERNKYRHQPPQIEYKEPNIVGQLLGINELLYDWEHGHAPLPLPTTAAVGSVSIDGGMLALLDNASFTIISTDGTSRQYIFDKDAAPDGTGPTVKIQGLGSDKAAIGAQLVLAINHSGGHNGKITAVSDGNASGPVITLTQATGGPGGNTTISKSDPSSGGLTIVSQFAGGTAPLEEEKNCVWWNERTERDGILTVSDNVDGDREKLRQRRNTIVSGSTYVLRKLSRPYKFSGENQRILNIGSNRKANKNKALYKPVIATGKEIQINSSDIYEFKQCNDVVDPQEEKIYTAKTNTTGTDGYLDADADMILPFSLYSSSAGKDFSQFKDSLQITNNHDDDIGILQSPYLRELAGGMPHRRVKFGTPDADRPEAYILSASNTTLTLKQHTGPKSYTTRGSGVASGYSIRNIKTDTTNSPVVLGNYAHDYDIVMTNGRNINNSYLIESGSILITPISEGYVAGMIDFTSPVRGRAEHIIVNQFSSPGGPETQGVYGRDKESGEYSIYNTLNYRNLSIRQPLNKLAAERSEQFGFRSGSAVNASMHMTNRNFFHMTSSLGEVSKPDNQFVQHPIPQNDFGYSWITASAINSKFDFVEANDGFGHQHLFNSASAKSIQFLGRGIHYLVVTGLGEGDDVIWFDHPSQPTGLGISGHRSETISFNNLNSILVEPIDENTNILGLNSYAYGGQVHSNGGTPSTRLEIQQKVPFLNADRFLVQEFGGINFTPARHLFRSALLNSIILNRQGPYGWPTWKQIRGGDHPIMQAHRRSNTFSRVFLGDPNIGASSIIRSSNTPSMNFAAQANNDISLDVEKSRMVKNYIEPIAINKFNPITITIHAGAIGAPDRQQLEYSRGDNLSLPQFFQSKRDDQPRLTQQLRESLWKRDGQFYRELDIPAEKVVTYTETFQNDLNVFSNEELIKDIEFEERDYHSSLDVVSEIYIANRDANNYPIEVSYSETIYPRELGTLMKNSRTRVNFDYFPWDSSRENRNLILSGNINNNIGNTMLFLTGNNGFHAFPEFTSQNTSDYKKSIFGKFDILRLGRASTTSALRIIPYHISSSSWPLDSRKNFDTRPVDIMNSFLTKDNAFLTGAANQQGTFAEGILQNDFSTFPLGMNNIYGTPPISMVYNRRIPQVSGSAQYLAGEAKWEAADNTRGPFYDSYSEYSEEIVNVAPDHSIIPEFRMSEFVEDVINQVEGYPNIGDKFLSLTGAIYQNSSGDVSVGGDFFKTYSNSDFLKYFSTYSENTEGQPEDPIFNFKHGRINFKCKAAMKFLPYKGFYPAERAVEISKIFHDNYLSDDLIGAARIKAFADGSLTTAEARRYAKLRANASRYQASKPLFGPGLLFNSIKAGVAVDYPIFSGSFDSVYDNLPDLTIMTNFSTINMPQTNLFTGSIINNTRDGGIPRISSSVSQRIQFEDLISPVNVFGDDIYDNEPHPSASLIYGNQHWHKIIERPAKFGTFDTTDAQSRLGITFSNTRRAFSRQMSAYTMASQNFAAETVNFFLEDGHLTTAISKPIRERFEAGTYKMRVYLTNTDTVMYDRASAFGPPVDEGGAGTNGSAGVSLTKYTKVGSTATRANFRLTFNDHHGSGGSVQYNVNAATASHFMPQLIFTDDNDKSLHVFLYNEDHFTAPSNPSSESGAVKVYLTSSAYAGVKSIFSSNAAANAWDFQNDHVALINVKNALGTAIATSFETALEDAGLGLDVIVNRSSNVLAVTSSVFGPRNNFSYAESERGDGAANNDGFMLTFPSRTSGGLPREGSYQDGTTGKTKLEGNVYVETHNTIIDIINDGESGQPAATTKSTVVSKIEHGFAPYVPPFLDPGSEPYVEVSFTTSEAGIFGAQEIIEKSTFEYYNFHTTPSNATTNTNYKESMSLSASLNLGICATLRTDNLEQIEGHQLEDRGGNFNIREIDPNNLRQRWVIQTKWETPILDFSDVTASAFNLQTNTVTQVSGSPWKNRYWDSYYDRGLPIAGATSGSFLTGSTGMWHQKGATLSENSSKGYFLSIKDVKQDDGSGGLAEKLGFNVEEEPSAGALKRAKNYRRRIGLVEDRKIVKEAIVAIPYVVREDLDNKIEFVRLSNAYYEIARQNVQEVRDRMKTIPLTDRILTIENYNSFKAQMDFEAKTPVSDAPIDAIEYQLFMMDEYILPPQLDFTRVPRDANAADIPDPFMMYFFQFHASFNREDLANIWQNLYPTSPGSTASPRYSYADEQLLGRIRPHNDVSYVSHYLETVELNGLPLCPADDPRALFAPSDDNKTRWLIFKVKQRGENNLEKIRRRSIDPREENIESVQYLAAAKRSQNSLTFPRNLPGRRQDGTMDLQFNWPYDYFSFVELIRLDAKIDSFNYDE